MGLARQLARAVRRGRQCHGRLRGGRRLAPQRRVGGSEHEAAHPELTRRLEEVERAENVDLTVAPGVLQGWWNATLRGEVHDRVVSGDVSSHPLVGYVPLEDRKSTRLNSSHQIISYAVFCLKKKK